MLVALGEDYEEMGGGGGGGDREGCRVDCGKRDPVMSLRRPVNI